jgi:hypothetical protein
MLFRTIERNQAAFWQRAPGIAADAPDELNPLLGAIRGRIVMLRDFRAPDNGLIRNYGMPYDAFRDTWQDDFEMRCKIHTLGSCGAIDMFTKWASIKNRLNRAHESWLAGRLNANGERAHINYLSAATPDFPPSTNAPFPFFVASGHSSPGTSDQREEITQMDWAINQSLPIDDRPIRPIQPQRFVKRQTPAAAFADFPRNERGRILYEGMNVLFYELLRDNADNIRNRETQYGYVGIVVADFPGIGLINRIIRVNTLRCTRNCGSCANAHGECFCRFTNPAERVYGNGARDRDFCLEAGNQPPRNNRSDAEPNENRPLALTPIVRQQGAAVGAAFNARRPPPATATFNRRLFLPGNNNARVSGNRLIPIFLPPVARLSAPNTSRRLPVSNRLIPVFAPPRANPRPPVFNPRAPGINPWKKI